MNCWKKRIALSMALVLVILLLLTACGKKETLSNGGLTDLGSYPINTSETLSLWCSLPANISSVTDNLATTPYSQELEKRTGVKVNYIHPAIGQEVEAFNLMVASNEPPDLISYNWSWYNGGVQRAMEDNIIVSLNDLMTKYAPNLTNFLNEHPEYDKMVKTDEKQYPYFPLILDGDALTVTTGPAIRKDLLDKYGLNMPETIDEWTNVLRVFKNNGIETPLSFDYASFIIFINMFSATKDFFMDEAGTIQYGPIDNSYKDAMIAIKEWFDEGLLDNNIVSVNSKMIDSYILSGKTAATVTAGGSGIGKYMDLAPDSEFNLVGAMYPSKEKGQISKYKYLAKKHSGNGIAITTACQKTELAARYLDYIYSAEGHMFANFGMEDVSYTMRDGEPAYTDLIMKNSDGNSVSQMLSLYTQANNGRAFVQDERYIYQYYSKPQQKIAIENWSKGADVARSSFALPYLNYTVEESEEYVSKLNEIVNYVNGMTVKFFTGVEPISRFDDYTKRIEALGIQKLIKIQNDAYARYKNR